MASKLLIVVANVDPHQPCGLGEPFSQACVAKAMEYDVEIILTGRSSELAVQGVAEQIALHKCNVANLYELIRNAHKAGVKIKASTAVQERWANEPLIPEIADVVGAAYLISEVMDSDTVTLSY